MAAKKKSTKKPAARAKAAKKSPAKRSAANPARAKAADRGLNLSGVATGLTVNDINQTLKWYCDVVGFVITQRWEREGVLTGAEVKAGRATLYLGQDDWQKGRDRVKGLGFRLYFETSQDVDKLAAGIKARGGTLASEPKDEYGMRSFSLLDPTGYQLTFSSER